MQDVFFKAIKSICDSNFRRHDERLGFNPFALMSDLYKRENFHSDVLCEILNPHGTHGEGARFLTFFIESLVDIAVKKTPPFHGELKRISLADEIIVSREEGKTDVAIYSKTKDWVIIIENKINGAPDMNRQIPRYIDYWKKKGKKVEAVVYIPATNNTTFPSTTDWSDNDKNEIRRLLLLFPGYVDQGCCIWSWLRKCEIESPFFNNKAVFAQYAALVKKQGGIIMDEAGIEKFLKQADECKVDLCNFRKMVNNLPNYYANFFVKKLSDNEVFDKVWIWHENVTVLDGYKVKFPNGIAVFAIDIHCEDLTNYGISIFLRRNDTGLTFTEVMEPVKTVLQKYNFVMYPDIWEDRYIWRINTQLPLTSELDAIAERMHYFLKELEQQFSQQLGA